MPLLSHISGINSTVAKNIVKYREENGAFKNRRELLKVPKLGAKTFEQCAGFLRISGGTQPLDNTAVHPEAYEAAKALLQKFGYSLEDAAAGKLDALNENVRKAGAETLAKELNIGVYTLDLLPPPLMRSGDVMGMADLKPGMKLTGTVRNIVDFGCFVDIGVHEDGLVHISQMSDKKFVKHPLDVVKVGDVVNVTVLDVDLKRKRISLTMKTQK